MNNTTERFIELIEYERDEKTITRYFKENEKDINIHAQNEEAFIYSCYFGHQEIVRLLIEKGVDIHAQNEDAYICSCVYGYPEIAKLLCQKCKDYFVMIKNDKIYDYCLRNKNKFVMRHPSLFRLKKICL